MPIYSFWYKDILGQIISWIRNFVKQQEYNHLRELYCYRALLRYVYFKYRKIPPPYLTRSSRKLPKRREYSRRLPDQGKQSFVLENTTNWMAFLLSSRTNRSWIC